MSTTEIIQQIKALPLEERKTVLTYLRRDVREEASLYDEFSLLGSDSQGADVGYAAAAQAEVVTDERP